MRETRSSKYSNVSRQSKFKWMQCKFFHALGNALRMLLSWTGLCIKISHEKNLETRKKYGSFTELQSLLQIPNKFYLAPFSSENNFVFSLEKFLNCSHHQESLRQRHLLNKRVINVFFQQVRSWYFVV